VIYEFQSKSFEKRESQASIDEQYIEDLRIISGHGIRVELTDITFDEELKFQNKRQLIGVLDSGVDAGKPIYLDDGKQHTSNLVKVINKNSKRYIITEDAIYTLDLAK
jgi:hypothetical protein